MDIHLLAELVVRVSSICGLRYSLFAQGGQARSVRGSWSCFWAPKLGGIVTAVQVQWWGLETGEHTCIFYGSFIRKVLGSFLGRFKFGWLLFCWHDGNCNNKLVGTWKKVQIFFFSEATAVFTLCLYTCRSNSSQILRCYRSEEGHLLRLFTSS